LLAGEKVSQQAAGAFVGSSKEAVAGAMLSCHVAVGVLSAGRTRTGVDDPPAPRVGQTYLLDHRTLPPFGQTAKGTRLLYLLIAQVTVEQGLSHAKGL
jgi:hypothetical protein